MEEKLKFLPPTMETIDEYSVSEHTFNQLKKLMLDIILWTGLTIEMIYISDFYYRNKILYQ